MVLAVACGDTSTGTAPDQTTTTADAGGEPTAAPNGFVGAVAGTDAFVAVVPGAEETVVYVCDGDDEIALWFRGATDHPGVIELTGDRGLGVTAHFEEEGYVGEVTFADGSIHEFAAGLAGPDAGLWVAHGEETAEAEVAAAWVIDNDGEERGAFLRSGRFQRTPRFSSSGVAFEDTRVRVSRIIAPSNVITPLGIIAPSNVITPLGVAAPNSISTGGSGGEDRIDDPRPELEEELKPLEGGGGG